MQYILGIDRGGTKCDAILVREDGVIVGRGRCDLTHPESGRGAYGSGRTEENRARAVRQALEGWGPPGSLFVVSDSPIPSEMLPSGVTEAVGFRRVSEIDLGLSFVEDGAGIAVQIGTGTLVFGRTRDGHERHVDGLGPFLGDYGSAYHIGSLAMRAAAKAAWHPRHRTTLSEVIPPACAAYARTVEGFDLVRYSLQQHDRAEIAALAALVDGEARRGDVVSMRILATAADDVSELVRDTWDELDVGADPLPLIGVGGVIIGSELYWTLICERVRAFAPQLLPIRITQPSVLGFVLLAARELALPDRECFRRNLFRSA